MYRNYIETSLDIDKLKEVNRNAPKDVKYCNFIKQYLVNNVVIAIAVEIT